MSKTTDLAVNYHNFMDEMEAIERAREEDMAMNWIARNPSKAFMAALMAAPKLETIGNGKAN